MVVGAIVTAATANTRGSRPLTVVEGAGVLGTAGNDGLILTFGSRPLLVVEEADVLGTA